MPHNIFLDSFSKDLALTSVLYLDSLYIECQHIYKNGNAYEGLELIPIGLLLKSKISHLWKWLINTYLGPLCLHLCQIYDPDSLVIMQWSRGEPLVIHRFLSKFSNWNWEMQVTRQWQEIGYYKQLNFSGSGQSQFLVGENKEISSGTDGERTLATCKSLVPIYLGTHCTSALPTII